MILKKIGNKLNKISNKFPGGNKLCYLCKKKVRSFYPFHNGSDSVSDFILSMNVVGSDVDNFSCPHCECHDRERHLCMYFDTLSIWDKIASSTVLHFAPEKKIKNKITECKPKEYVKGDLFPSQQDIIKIDVTCIQFIDNYFDLIICNHVLEHVPDDEKALSELYRVLKPGGICILQTPYSPILRHSFYDENIVDDATKVITYGQEDHVRLYGLDFFTRIEKAGFTLDIKQHQEILNKYDVKVYGVNPKESLIMAVKREKHE